jgi:ADP-heptose:LPS heptosyltransferase
MGDMLVALPSLRLVAEAFPDSERRLLTNFSIALKAAPASQLLDYTGLIHGYIEYPLGTRDWTELRMLRRAISAWKPDVMIYLASPRGRLKAWRDALFFKSCGIRRIVGLPLFADQQRHLGPDAQGRYESEGHRLIRMLSPLGKADLGQAQNWSIGITHDEEIKGINATLPLNDNPFIALSLGTKVDTNKWGLAKWSDLLGAIGQSWPDLGLILLGSKDEFAESETLRTVWRQKSLNLCGALSPRESAAVLQRATLFVGQDSGPMHLAASVGTPTIAVFSARNLPGIWFPHGDAHTPIYHMTDCAGCALDFCVEHNKKCINSIPVDEVLSAVNKTLLAIRRENSNVS